MAKKQSQTAEHKTRHQVTVGRLVDHGIETYKPHKAPIVLMWREYRNGYNLSQSDNADVWTQDNGSVHEDWKRYGRNVIRQMAHRYKLTIVPVNSRVRQYLKHGGTPDCDDRCRTSEWYKSCLPSSSHKCLGFIAFPPRTQEDHPAILAAKAKGKQFAGSVVENYIVGVDTANGHGTLSDQAREEIYHDLGTRIRHVMEDKHPLFKNLSSNGGNQAPETPPA